MTPRTASLICTRLMLEHAAVDVPLRERQTAKRNFVVIRCQRLLLEEHLGLMRRLVGVVCEHSLIKTLLQSQSGLVAENDIEEFQSLDMSTEHDKAERQRSRKKQSNRPPKPGPERGRNHNGNGRKP